MSNLNNPMERKSFRNNYFLLSFLLGLGLSFLIFIPFIIRDGGRFLFYGDFNVQQVAFYRIAHDAIRSGNIGWSHLTDLGANFIGSYSFYLLGSPFFWITVPFPSEWLQYFMGPLLILKFAFATLSGYIFIHRYVKSPRNAVIGALLYAFSGFSIYNVFFNHFHEAIIVFPLLLASLDEFMYKKRRGIFALAVAFCAIVNYYFFCGMVAFTAIYFFVKLISKSWKITLKDFIAMAIEAVLGLLISGFILLPSVLCVMQNSRVSNPINGWSALLYDRVQRYLHIIECFFFLPDLPARPNFTPDSNSKWSSLGAFLPLFSMSGVIGWLQMRRKHWLKRMIYICFAMALIPGFNSMFQLMNGSYYARWYYMLTLIMALATVMSLENEQVDWRRSIKWTALITAFITAAVAFTPTITKSSDGSYSFDFGLEDYPTRLWSYAAVSFISLAILTFFIVFCKKKEGRFTRAFTPVLSLVIVLESIYFIALGKTQTEDPYTHIIPYELNGGADVGKNQPLKGIRDGTDAVRTDFYESMDNAAMFWELPSIQAFHSIVPGSVMDFYTFIGVTRDVASRPDSTHYALRSLTSVLWLFDDDDDSDYFTSDDGTTAMPGWDYYSDQNGYEIYENTNYIPMGFSYDSYITYSEAEALTTEKRELVMLKAIILEDGEEDDPIEYITDDIDIEDETASSSADSSASPDASANPDSKPTETKPLSQYCGLTHLDTEEQSYDYDSFVKDCKERNSSACTYFTYTDSGFEAYATTETSQIMFFSVPYEDGWTAYVNGVETKIYKANVGFMAVVIPEGENNYIVFKYTTPGLHLGILITVCAVLLLLVYILFFHFKRKRKNLASVQDLHNNKIKPSTRSCGKFSVYARKNNLKFVKIKRGKYFMVVRKHNRESRGK